MKVPGFLRKHVISGLLAASAIASTFGPLVGPASADTSAYPTRYISDMHVISGDSSNITCPDGYTKLNQDLNEGSGGKYVYACAWYDTNPSTAIQELYVHRYYVPYGGSGSPSCNSD